MSAVAPAPNRLLIPPREAADVLGISERKLYSITSPRGPIPCVRLGTRAVRYSIVALEKWISEQADDSVEA